GVPVDWDAFYAGTGARRVDLPTYAFDHHHYWIADGAPPETVISTGPAVTPAESGLRERLAELPASDRDSHLLDAVCEQTAAVLGHADPGAIDPERPFHETGFDSLTAVELVNRINRISGLALPPTLVFDHPSPTALATHLRTLLSPEPEPSLDDLFALVDKELGPEGD
ncbi:acyl carrier protein, partial [Streptomyces sp. NPDC052040]|uniref:acyl carrier protein n=1 Tax=unclassified Streptomyces TaxID=2593676 RepID=UPI0037CD5E81